MEKALHSALINGFFFFIIMRLFIFFFREMEHLHMSDIGSSRRFACRHIFNFSAQLAKSDWCRARLRGRPRPVPAKAV